MLTPQGGGFGLGLSLEGAGENLRFYHGGRNQGFDALLVAGAHAGNGVAILINSNDLSGAIKDVVREIAREYLWS